MVDFRITFTLHIDEECKAKTNFAYQAKEPSLADD